MSRGSAWLRAVRSTTYLNISRAGRRLARSPSSIGGANQQLGNDELLRLHAIQLARAGIDFVAVDFSNHDSLSYEYVNIEYLEPLRHLLTV
jgi:hypothetical protein